MVKIIIVGGVAGGASAATRARRLSENAEVILLKEVPIECLEVFAVLLDKVFQHWLQMGFCFRPQ